MAGTMAILAYYTMAFLLLLTSGVATDDSLEKLVITRASREVDLSSNLVKESVTITLSNDGDVAVSTFLYTLDAISSPNLAHLSVKVSAVSSCTYAIFFLGTCVGQVQRQNVGAAANYRDSNQVSAERHCFQSGLSQSTAAS